MNDRRGGAPAVIALPTLMAGQFLMTLDSSVMNVAIATVAKDVGTTVTGIQTAIADLKTALTGAGASAEVTQAVLDENEPARLDGLRVALAALALLALIGLFFSTR